MEMAILRCMTRLTVEAGAGCPVLGVIAQKNAMLQFTTYEDNKELCTIIVMIDHALHRPGPNPAAQTFTEFVAVPIGEETILVPSSNDHVEMQGVLADRQPMASAKVGSYKHLTERMLTGELLRRWCSCSWTELNATSPRVVIYTVATGPFLWLKRPPTVDAAGLAAAGIDEQHDLRIVRSRSLADTAHMIREDSGDGCFIEDGAETAGVPLGDQDLLQEWLEDLHGVLTADDDGIDVADEPEPGPVAKPDADRECSSDGDAVVSSDSEDGPDEEEEEGPDIAAPDKLMAELGLYEDADSEIRRQSDNQSVGRIRYYVIGDGQFEGICSCHSDCSLLMRERPNREQKMLAIIRWLHRGAQCSADEHWGDSDQVKRSFGIRPRRL